MKNMFMYGSPRTYLLIVLFLVQILLMLKFYAPQVRPDLGSNLCPLDQCPSDAIVLTTHDWPSGTFHLWVYIPYVYLIHRLKTAEVINTSVWA